MAVAALFRACRHARVRRTDRRDLGRDRVRRPVVCHGARSLRALRPVRRAPLDAGAVVKAFVDGVTAAATGAIAGAAVILGRRALVDPATILVALVTLALLLAPRKIPEPLLIVAAGLVGLVLKRTTV